MPTPRQVVAKLEEERALLKRILLSIDDFFVAGRHIERLRRVRQFRKAPKLDGTTREALQIAIVVSYARPFSGNRPARDVQRGLPSFVDRLPAKRRALHDRLITLRHKQFAHSDPIAADLEVRVVQGSGRRHAVRVRSVSEIRIALNPKTLAAIDSLIEFQLRHCHREVDRILQLLPAGDQF
jgi:hypothetical protein